MIFLRRQFSLDKIKDDNSSILFYTGFPSFKALISSFKNLEPKLAKMLYWKGEHLVRERQPYQEDENKNKPGPSRKLTFLDEFLLVLTRLKAGLFVLDLADRFGFSKNLVPRICITWINLLYFELKDRFPFPSQELVPKRSLFSALLPCLHILKLGLITNTTILGSNWWESLQMAKLPFFQTSGVGGFQINR